MMRVRIIQPTTVRLVLKPGDEIHLQEITPEVQALVAAARLDGLHVAELVEEEELAVLSTPETGMLPRGRRRSSGGSDAA